MPCWPNKLHNKFSNCQVTQCNWHKQFGGDLCVLCWTKVSHVNFFNVFTWHRMFDDVSHVFGRLRNPEYHVTLTIRKTSRYVMQITRSDGEQIKSRDDLILARMVPRCNDDASMNLSKKGKPKPSRLNHGSTCIQDTSRLTRSTKNQREYRPDQYQMNQTHSLDRAIRGMILHLGNANSPGSATMFRIMESKSPSVRSSKGRFEEENPATDQPHGQQKGYRPR